MRNPNFEALPTYKANSIWSLGERCTNGPGLRADDHVRPTELGQRIEVQIPERSVEQTAKTSAANVMLSPSELQKDVQVNESAGSA